jgi:hypothetical protein
MAVDRHSEGCFNFAGVTDLHRQDAPPPLPRDHLRRIPALDAGPIPEDRDRLGTRDNFFE